MSPAIQRLAFVSWLEEMQPNLMVTIGAGPAFSPGRLKLDVEKHLNAIERRALGPRWAAKPAAERMIAIGCLEHAESNAHYHLLAQAPDRHEEALFVVGEERWRQRHPGGVHHVQRIDSVRKGARYSTKELWSERSFDAIIIHGPRRDLR